MKVTTCHYWSLIGAICLMLVPTLLHSKQIPQDSLEFELQNAETDSARAQIYRHLIWGYIRNNPNQALKHTNDFRQMACKAKNNTWADRARYYFGVAYRSIGQYGLASVYMDSCVQYLRTVAEPERLAAALYQQGVIQGSMSMLHPGIAALNESIEIYQEISDTLYWSMSTNAKGFLFRQCKQFERALAAYRQSHTLCQQIGDSIGMADALHNMGNAHRDLGRYDSAHIYFDLCENIKSIPHYEFGMGAIYENRGVLFALQGQHHEALKWLRKSLSNRMKFQNHGPAIAARLSLARSFLKLNQLDSAKAHTALALSQANQRQMHGYLKDAYKSQADIFEKLGLPKKALSSLHSYRFSKDAIFNETMAQQFATIETIFKKQRQETEVQQLSNQNKLSRFKLNQQKIRLLGLSIACLLFGVLLVKIFMLHANTRQQNKLIQQTLKQRENLLGEIHQRVKENLHIIGSLLDLQSTTSKSKSLQSAFVDSKARVRSMSLIHDDLYGARNLDGQGIKRYIQKLCSNLFDTYNIYGNKIKLSLEIDPGRLDISVLVPIGLILNELITNALKYAFITTREGNLTVQLKKVEQVLILSVADDGCGLPHDSEEVGFGRRLISALAKKLKAQMTISNLNGTAVSLAIHNFK